MYRFTRSEYYLDKVIEYAEHNPEAEQECFRILEMAKHPKVIELNDALGTLIDEALDFYK
jgi:hypothetical protein